MRPYDAYSNRSGLGRMKRRLAPAVTEPDTARSIWLALDRAIRDFSQSKRATLWNLVTSLSMTISSIPKCYLTLRLARSIFTLAKSVAGDRHLKTRSMVYSLGTRRKGNASCDSRAAILFYSVVARKRRRRCALQALNSRWCPGSAQL